MRDCTNLISAALCSALFVHAASAAFYPAIEKLPILGSAIVVSSETVGDKVDYAPNIEDGSFASPEKRWRYQSAKLGYVYRPASRSLLSFSASHRQVNSLRDSYEISQFEIANLYRLSPIGARYFLDFSAAASANYSNSLVKNSFSSVNGNLITQSTIDNAHDVTLSLNLLMGSRLGNGFSIAAFSGGGAVHSAHNSVNGIGLSTDGCRYSFETDGSNGSLQQIGSCGDVLSYQQTYATEQGVEDRLGFRASRDIAYRARFIQAGTELRWSHQRFAASLGYRYRRYFRGALDREIAQNEGTPVRVSQIVNASFAYKFVSKLSLSLGVSYHTAPFLDETPLLYTAFTNERYHKNDAVSFNVGLSWSFGG